MPCKYMDRDNGNCTKKRLEMFCPEWCVWYYDEKDDDEAESDFCRDEQYRDRWGK